MTFLYRLLLRMYPVGFRVEYGDEMLAVFAEKRRNASGIIQTLGVWTEAVSDVLQHAVPLQTDALRHDLRYARRSFIRAPGFAFTVITVSALGIGANTAVFTVVDRVLIRSLPFDDPDRIVRVWESPPGYGQMEASPPNYRDWLEMATSFQAMAAYYRTSGNLVGQGEPERITGAELQVGMLELLGRRPLLGAGFDEGDDVYGAVRKILLSYGLWQRSFGGDPDVLGRSVVLDDVPHVIAGVMPRDFLFPDRRSQYWTALQISPGNGSDRNNNYLEVMARLGPGVTRDHAAAEMRQVMARLEAEYPVANENNSASVNLLKDEIPRQSRMLLISLIGAALCVLLIACTNLANLLLARAMSRRQEMAVRSSLGAGRERLVRQMLTESLVYALLGGAFGILLAYLALPFLVRLIPATVPVPTSLTLDSRVLLFAFAVTGVTGVGFGVFPALRAGRRASAGLRETSRAGGGRREGMRSALVVVEVAACVVLLIASGLLIRALNEVRATDPGFRTGGVVTARTWLPWPRYETTAARTDFYGRVLTELRAMPGVESAAYTSFLPMVMGGGIWPALLDDAETRGRSENVTASLRFVTPDYFNTMGIRVQQGRDVRESDGPEDAFVAVVSQSFVDRFWPGEEALGRTFGFAFFERTVVGVVDDVHVRGLERESEPQVYLSYQQVPDQSLVFYAPKDLVVKVTGDPGRVGAAIRDIVSRADPLQPVTDVQSLAAIVAANTSSRDLQLKVLSAFAVLAFLLAAVGIHGLLSFSTTTRAREIGVRMAMGARPSGIVRLFLREGVVLGGLGVLIGAGVGYLAGRALEALLFGVAPLDPLTFATALGLAMAMTLAGSLPPAVRAARLDPNIVLRES